MSTKFYLPRILTSNEKSYSELELLDASRFIVVLAEPGGGKTELVHSLADKLGCAVVTANVFGQIGAKIENNSLVIDAFDELAKLDKTGIHKILGNAKKAHPTNVIVSSRSSEWDNAATSSFEDFLARIIHRMFWSRGFCARKRFHICRGKRVCCAGFPALAFEFAGFSFGATGRCAA